MKRLSCQEIRELWVNYFSEKCPSKHQAIKSASLVPDNPTLLLNAAGMVQFVPIFMGTKPAPEPPRAVTVQKCARVGGKDSDLENIGRTTRHHSFFEMLGNFSFGDYFKAEAIAWAWDFLTKELEIDSSKLFVSVFEGDEQNNFDEEAYSNWDKVLSSSFPNDEERKKRIWKMTRKDNFWGPPGATGPCGPSSEIYFDLKPELGLDTIDIRDEASFDERFVEIWNLVFMEFNKDEEGKFSPLEKKNIDTGAGLERLATISQDVANSFETDELFSVLETIAKEIGLNYQTAKEEEKLYLKIITDHLRCSAFLISDGVRPSNLGRGYVLRMIIRRAARFVYLLRNKADAFLFNVAESLINAFEKAYPELKKNQEAIQTCLEKEELAFAKTLEQGMEVLNKEITQLKSGQELSGAFAFDLYSTYGFPLELTQDVVENKGIKIDLESFEAAKEKHAAASGSGAFEKSVDSNSFVAELLKEYGKTKFLGYDKLETKAKILYAQDNKVVLDQSPFYAESGGQLADKGSIAGAKVTGVKSIEGIFVHEVDDSSKLSLNSEIETKVDSHNREFTKKHHTSCHLLQAALRKVLGNGIQQMGSQVGPEYTRFDFNLDRAMKKEELKKVEELINAWINKDYEVETKVMQYDEAVNQGALSFFEDKYEDEVRVLFIGDNDKVSVELCGGTHVNKLSEIKNISIVSESSIASGIRRIKLLAHEVADRHLAEEKEAKAKQAAEEEAKAKAKEEQKAKVKAETQELLSKLDELYGKQEEQASIKLAILDINQIFAKEFNSEAVKALVEALADKNKAESASYFIFAASSASEKLVFFAAASDDIAKKDSVYNAGNIVREAAKICGGGGGGRPNFAQAGGKDLSKVNEAIDFVKDTVLGKTANA